MKEKTTGELLRVLKSTHSKAELDTYIEKNTKADEEITFASVFSDILAERGIVKADAIKNAMLDRTYGYQMLSGAKNPGRNKILALAIGNSLSLKETTRLLAAAKEGVLYAKSRRDAIIIYGIEHKMTLADINMDLHEAREEIIE